MVCLPISNVVLSLHPVWRRSDALIVCRAENMLKLESTTRLEIVRIERDVAKVEYVLKQLKLDYFEAHVQRLWSKELKESCDQNRKELEAQKATYKQQLPELYEQLGREVGIPLEPQAPPEVTSYLSPLWRERSTAFQRYVVSCSRGAFYGPSNMTCKNQVLYIQESICQLSLWPRLQI